MQMETILSTPEIVLQPPAKEVFQLTMQCVRDCIESTKHFVRWMNGKNMLAVVRKLVEGTEHRKFYVGIHQTLC